MSARGLTLVAERPEPTEPRPWHFPTFDRGEVGGGRVLACHLPGRPLAVASLVVDAGAVIEPEGQEGVALLLARALSEGTNRLDAYAFAVAGERLGATWRAGTDWDSLRCGFEVPVDHLTEAVDLLAEAVREPGLDDATLERVRDERVDEVHLDSAQPGAMAAKAFAAALWSAESRYARPDGGDVASVSSLTPEDIRAFHTVRFAPDSATLVLVGDLTDVDPAALGARLFGDWSAASAMPSAPAVASRSGDRRVIIVDRAGSVQSMLYAGHDAPARSTPDYVPMTTMALVLGGMFNSRLNHRLREDKGYAYGAFGSFDNRRHGGSFSARAAVQTEVTTPALQAMVREIELLHADGVTAEELDNARSYRAGVFPINFAGPGPVASGLGDLVIHGFPDDHFDRLRADVLAVDIEAVNTAAKIRLRPDALLSVVVGDASVIADDLSAAGLGPVEVIPAGD